MLRKQITYDQWYKKCITFTSTWEIRYKTIIHL
jgi:hypothetical protein